MRKTIILLTMLFTLNVFAQNVKQRLPFYFDYMVIPDGEKNECVISYKIPFNQLVFTTENKVYKASVSLSFEIKGENGIERVFDEREITTKSYENVFSSVKFIEGVVKTELRPGKYSILPYIEIHNTNISSPLFESEIVIEKKTEDFINPFVVEEKSVKCEDGEAYKFENFRGNLVFTNNPVSLLFPVRNCGVNSLKVKILQNNNEVFSGTAEYIHSNEIDIQICNNSVVIPKKNKGSYKIFKLNNFNSNIDEGSLSIEVQTDTIKKVFNLTSEWIEKPRSLRNLKLAVKSLRIIGEEANFNDNYDDDSYPDLKKFWEKYDPTPKTKFNELMEEFYQRVDYGMKEFSTLKNFDGAFTDRGEVYVKYGKPDEIDRNYNKRNEIIETWTYSEPDKVFIFRDVTGTGNFKIIN